MNMSNKLYNGKIPVFIIDSIKLSNHIYTLFFNTALSLLSQLINYLNMHASQINLSNDLKKNCQTHILQLKNIYPFPLNFITSF